MKTTKQLKKISQFLCLLLRHKPQAADLDMDTQGWVSVEQLLANIAVNEKNAITLDELKSIVDDDNKGRYSFREDFAFIRCNQGHSLDWVEIDFQPYRPTEDLYHGTKPSLESVIMTEGLTPQSRNYVHLSKDLDTAKTVGKRHSKKDAPLIFVIDKDAPIEFFITDNGVVHAKEVPPEYLSVLKD